MRARSALVLAAVLAVPLVLAAVPPRADEPLRGHSAAGVLSANLEAVLDRVAGTAPRTAPGLLPALASVPPGPGARLHVLHGDRASTVWIPAEESAAVDLDGDGLAELRAAAAGGELQVEGLAPARQAWAAWLERDGARVGLTGIGAPPASATVVLREGDLRVHVEEATSSWHAGFAFAGAHRRTLAWLADGEGADLHAALGHGFRLAAPTSLEGGLRVLLADGLGTHDLTLQGVPAGAQLVVDPSAGLLYRAPRGGGALAYEGDAALVGQRGDLGLRAAPLPRDLALAADGAGFALAAAPAAAAVVDWRPPGAEGLRFVANEVERVAVQPGEAGGYVLRGTRGQVAVERPSVHGDAGGLGTVVDLGTQGATAVAAPSPLLPALVALALGALVVWALKAPPKKAAQRQVE